MNRNPAAAPRLLPLVRPSFSPHTNENPDLEVSEVFESIQGEGVTAGQPCVFLRLAMCNLRCRWCDTRYTWDFDGYDRDREVTTYPVTSLVDALARSPAQRVVITGGEPLLQQPAIEALLARLNPNLAVEIETNGTLEPTLPLVARINQWNVSPKLSNSGDPEPARVRPRALRALRDTRRAWLKLVVADPADLGEADELIARLDWPRDHVLLMPRAASREELRDNASLVARAAMQRGYRFSPRLHIELWGGQRGT